LEDIPETLETKVEEAEATPPPPPVEKSKVKPIKKTKAQS
jgi:hypothetical protein